MAGVECRGRTIALNYGLVTSGLYASGTSRLRHHVTSRLLTLQSAPLSLVALSNTDGVANSYLFICAAVSRSDTDSP